MADEIKVYLVIEAQTVTTPTEQQWRDLFSRARTYPLATAILAAVRHAQNDIQAHKRSLNITYLLKWTLIDFEINAEDVASIRDIVNTQAVLRSIIGTLPQKFTAVLQAELRDAAVALGYTQTQANKLIMTLVSYGDRTTAELAAQQYLATNTHIWHEAV